jgi:hypothetical protein
MSNSIIVEAVLGNISTIIKKLIVYNKKNDE